MNTLLALLVLLQDKTAEETFTELEARLVKAKTLTIKYRLEQSYKISNRGWSEASEGSLLFKDGNRASLSRRWKSQNKEHESLTLLDGRRQFAVAGASAARMADPPKDLAPLLRRAFARAGVFQMFWMIDEPPLVSGREVRDPDAVMGTTDFKFGDDRRSLTYVLKFYQSHPGAPDGEACLCTLSYDPSTLKPLSRTLKALKPTARGDLVFTETYAEVATGADLADAAFQAPAGAAVLSAGPDPTEVYRSIEEKALEAKSLSLKYDASDAKGNFTVSGSILMKAGNKFRQELDWKRGGRTDHTVSISDGKQIARSNDGAFVDEFEATPPESNRETAIMVVRLGWVASFSLLFGLGESKGVSFEKNLVAHNFLLEAPENGLGVLRYRVSLCLPASPPQQPQTVQLFYDPKTLAPVKRIVQAQASSFTENYKDWAVGVDIPDEKFKLPEKK